MSVVGVRRPRNTRVRGWRMTHKEWCELRALAREDGCTPGQLIRELVVRERIRRAQLADALAVADKAGV